MKTFYINKQHEKIIWFEHCTQLVKNNNAVVGIVDVDSNPVLSQYVVTLEEDGIVIYNHLDGSYRMLFFSEGEMHQVMITKFDFLVMRDG